MAITVKALGLCYIKSTTFTWFTDNTASLRLDKRGLRLDRQWVVVGEGNMFVAQRKGSPTPAPTAHGFSGKPSLKPGLGIEIRSMCQIHARIEDEFLALTAPGMPKLFVSLDYPEGKEKFVQVWRDNQIEAKSEGLDAGEWFTEFLSRERPGKYRLMRMSSNSRRRSKDGGALMGFHDAYPFMMITQESLDLLNIKLKEGGNEPVPINRFRPTIVFSGVKAPHAEDHFRRIRIGGVDFEGRSLCDRCPVICTDQETAERFHEPLRTLATYRKGSDIGIGGDSVNKVYFGRNFNHVTEEGVISVGDTVHVFETD